MTYQTILCGIFGVLLTISEILPFTKWESNGIVHFMFPKIAEEKRLTTLEPIIEEVENNYKTFPTKIRI